ncbi:MAG: M12 family metallo-peptidase [Planctomycetota bacterium]
MSLESPMALFAALIATFLAGVLSAQQPPSVLLAPPDLLRGFSLSGGTAQSLLLPLIQDRPFTVDVALDGIVQTLELAPHDVRSPDFHLLVDDGRGLRQLPTPASVTFRGAVRGHPESSVAASLVAGQLWALVALRDGTQYGIQPMSEVNHGLPREAHIVYRGRDVIRSDVRCGAATAPPPLRRGGGDAGPAALKRAEIAVDADLAYLNRYGGNATTVHNNITSVINSMGVIYRRDVEIDYDITAIIVRTVNIYSWTGNLCDLHDQFANYWSSNHGGVRRDVAHLFTGEGSFSGVVGCAYLGVVCTGLAYGSSKAYSSNLSTNVGLVSHEVGHNWNARHCDSTSPCNIMCSTINGCSRNIASFAPASIGSIIAFKDTRNCLGDPIAFDMDWNLGIDVRSVFTGDFNGDGKADVGALVGTSDWRFRMSSGTGWQSADPRWDLSWDMGPGVRSVFTGDFNGDGKADVGALVGTSDWRFRMSSGTGWQSADPRWDLSWDMGPDVRSVFAGDFDGDGKADVGALVGTSDWRFRMSSGTGWQSADPRWDLHWDVGPALRFPIAGDFSGDRRADIGRLSGTANWQFRLSLGDRFEQSSVIPVASWQMAPTSTTSYAPRVIVVTGQRLDSVIGVTVGMQSVPYVFSSLQATIEFTPPSPGPIGSQPVSLINLGGASVPLPLAVSGNHPSVLVIPDPMLRGFSNLLRIHSDASWGAILILSPSNLPSSLPGIVSLGIGSGFTQLFTLGLLMCGGDGAAGLDFLVPPSLPPGLTLYWQAITLDPSNVVPPLETSSVQSAILR